MIVYASKVIQIGRLGENQARTIRFCIADILHEFPGCTFTMLNKRPGDISAYPVPAGNVAVDGQNLLWTVVSGDVAYEGLGECEIVANVDGKIVKTQIWRTSIGHALDGAGDPPDPWQSWVQDVTDAADRAEAAAELLEHPGAQAETLDPGSEATASYVDGVFSFGIPRGADGEDGYSPTASVSKSGKKATITITDKNGTKTAQVKDGTDGTDGYSPTASVTKSGDTATISITDKNGTTTAEITDGQDGDPGATPVISIGTVTTLSPGSDATASMDVTDPEHPVLSFGIPEGEPGEVTEAELNAVAESKADVITDTASGAIASFPDGANGMPVKSLVVGINPVQDLHGQESPYPAGAGANRWDEQWELGIYSSVDGEKVDSTSAKRRIRTKNHIPILPETTYCKIAPTGGFQWVAYYDAEKTFLSSANLTEGNKTFTTPSGAYYLTSWTNSDDYGTSYKNDMGFNYPSTANSYAPYSNICPISGRTGANVSRTGKNLIQSLEQGTFNSLGQESDSTTRVRTSDYIKVGEGKTYTVSGSSSASGTLQAAVTYFPDNEGSARIDASSWQNVPVTVETPTGTEYVKVLFRYSGDSAISVGNITAQLEIGSSASTHEDFTGNDVYSITFPSSAGTVYGGTLTVNKDGTGEMVVEWANIASYNGETLPGRWISDRDVYDPGTTPTTGAQVVYELATPVTYQLTNQQVIETLKGVNNVWTDTNGTNTVKYLKKG